MEDCIFCKIVAGSIPAEKVYEDEGFIAFLDIRPRGTGHVQIIPKEHHRWVWDVPTDPQSPSSIGRYFEIAQKIAFAQRKAFRVDMIRSQVFGNEIPHAHLWVWPDTDANKEDIAENAQKLREALG